jgi:glycine/D-amino acid oxidase-like deaminating enzyme
VDRARRPGALARSADRAGGGDRIGWAASGRNGGFCAASLTHGEANGRQRWPSEYAQLEALGRRNLDELEADLARHRIDADFQRTGELTVATEPHQVADLHPTDPDDATQAFFDREQIRAEVHSPTYLAAHLDRTTALVDPARLAWGLADAAERLGVHVHEHTPVTALRRRGAGLELETPRGAIAARRSRSAPTRSRRWCAGSASTPCRCTTTCW